MAPVTIGALKSTVAWLVGSVTWTHTTRAGELNVSVVPVLAVVKEFVPGNPWINEQLVSVGELARVHDVKEPTNISVIWYDPTLPRGK